MDARKLAIEVRDGIEWLLESNEKCGCCHWSVGRGLAIAMGWMENRIIFVVGKETFLSCDIIDFPMPCDNKGNCYDTTQTVIDLDEGEGAELPTLKDCHLIALDMNRAARYAKKAVAQWGYCF